MGHVQGLYCRCILQELWPEGHQCLSRLQPKDPLVIKAVKPKEEAFSTLSWRTPEAAERYRVANRTVASVIADVKSWV